MAQVINLEDQNIVKCKTCGRYVKYETSDVKGDYEHSAFGTVHWTYIECPNCKSQIQF